MAGIEAVRTSFARKRAFVQQLFPAVRFQLSIGQLKSDRHAVRGQPMLTTNGYGKNRCKPARLCHVTNMKVTGKVALITGASRGIGRGTAICLAEHGADIVINYPKCDDEAQQTADAVSALGRKAPIVQADVSDRDAVEATFDTASSISGISISSLPMPRTRGAGRLWTSTGKRSAERSMCRNPGSSTPANSLPARWWPRCNPVRPRAARSSS
jgi:hypothetical protein